MIIPISLWPGHMMNCYLIKGDRGLVLVDTGVPGSSEKIFHEMEKTGFTPADIQLIIVTHSHMDHFGSVGEIKKSVQAPVMGHELDVAYYEKGIASTSTLKPTVLWAHIFKRLVKDLRTVPFKPDIILQKEWYDLSEYIKGAHVIHTPGHTPGSISVILPNRQAIIMDMMSSGVGLGGLFWHSRVKHPAFHDDLSQLKQSFNTVLQYDIDTFYLGHGKPVNRRQVERYMDKYLKAY